MAHYIIQVIAFQLLFLVTYDLFLKKETFFQWNRVYLIATSILSFGLPFIKIGLIQRSIPQEYMVQLPAILIGGLALVAGGFILSQMKDKDKKTNK